MKTKGLITDFDGRKNYKIVFSPSNKSLDNISFSNDNKWGAKNKEDYIETKLIYLVDNHKTSIDKTKYKIGNIYDVEYQKKDDKYVVTLKEKEEKYIKKYRNKRKKINGIIKILIGIIVLVLLFKFNK